ncbi:MAG: PDZ domain-containing protein [Pirellulales bacterium]
MRRRFLPTVVGLSWLLVAAASTAAQEAAPPAAEPAPTTVAPAPAAPATAPAPLPNSGFLGLGVADQPDGQAMRVLAVHPQSPAALAGVQPQDQLVAVNGQPVPSRAEFGRLMNSLPPGQTVLLEYWREGSKHSISVKLGTRPADLNAVPPAIAAPQGAVGAAAPGLAAANNQTLPPAAGPLVPPGPPMLGVRTMPVSQAMQRQLGLPHARGAYVADIVPGSPADAAGVPIGSVIWAFNRADVDNPAELATAILQAGPGARVLLTLSDRGETRRINVVLAGAKSSAGAAEWRAPEPAAAAVEGPIDAATVALLKDEIRELTDRVQQLEAKLKAAGINPDAP